jgi:hypothetical protein
VQVRILPWTLKDQVIVVAISSEYKDALTLLVNSHYKDTVTYTEAWETPNLKESYDIEKTFKLRITMHLTSGDKSCTFFSVVQDKSQASIDKAYGKFLNSMTAMLAHGRAPFES